MICNRCFKDFENTDDSIRIQQNFTDGKWYCMQCAIELDEIIDSLGEAESLPEYITGKNKCVL